MIGNGMPRSHSNAPLPNPMLILLFSNGITLSPL
jgi:hypothetical protein